MSRDRVVAFALSSIAADGLPRVSGYTCDTLERDGLIAQTGNPLAPYRLTLAGTVVLEAVEEWDQ